MSTVTLATPQKPENGAARGQASTQVELGGGGGVRGQLSSMSGLLIRKCCLSLQGVHRVGPVLDTYSQSDINLPAARLDAPLGSESLSAAPQSSGVLFRAAPASRSYYGIEKQQRGGEVSSQLSPSEANSADLSRSNRTSAWCRFQAANKSRPVQQRGAAGSTHPRHVRELLGGSRFTACFPDVSQF